MRPLFSLLALAIFLPVCLADLCTDACDRDHTQGIKVTWCGSDDKTHTTSQGAIMLDQAHLASDCYSLCGISVKHVGMCGCPNNCYNETGNGVCDTKKKECNCKSGWKGADCSGIKCSDNKCSNNGKCKSQDKSKGDDYCICNNGWTGYDCSVKIPSHFTEVPYGTLPFGEFDSSIPYYKGESHGDSNPVFNISTIATVKITLDDDDLNYQVNPENRRDLKYVDANMFFDNGVVSTYQGVQFRIKGLSSRMLSKKSWNIKFKNSWNDVLGFSLKAGPGDRSVAFPLVAELYRMMNTQTYRVSFANLFVNGFFYGIYSLHERFDEQFMKSRFDVKASEGNLYQLGATFYGEYWGSIPQPYQEFTTNVFDQIPIAGIEQQEGNGDWMDLTMLFTVLNASNMALPFVSQYFDYNHFLRYTSVDLAIDNFDSYYGTGNNWMLMNSGHAENPYWTQFATDFDNSFQSPYGIAGYLGMTPTQLMNLINSGVTSLGGFDLLAYALAPNPYIVTGRSGRPVSSAVYGLSGSNDTFTAAMTDLVQRLIFAHPGRLQTRLAAFRDMTRSMMLRDKMFTLPGFSLNAGPASYDNAYNNTTPAWLAQKYSFLGSMFIAKGHGTCDALANCVCNAHYSGPTCQTYTP